MKIRSELNALAADIRSATTVWDGGEKIKIGQFEMTVAQVAQNVLGKLQIYQTEKKSLKRRIETSRNLLNALNDLRDKSLDPTKETDLISTLRNVTTVISSAVQIQTDLKGKVSQTIQQDIIDSIRLDFSAAEMVKCLGVSSVDGLPMLLSMAFGEVPLYHFPARQSVLKRFQRVIKQISPETAKILEE